MVHGGMKGKRWQDVDATGVSVNRAIDRIGSAYLAEVGIKVMRHKFTAPRQ